MNNILTKLSLTLGFISVLFLCVAISFYPVSVYDTSKELIQYTEVDFTIFKWTLSLFGISGFIALCIAMYKKD